MPHRRILPTRHIACHFRGSGARIAAAFGLAIVSGCAEPAGPPAATPPLPSDAVAAVRCTVRVADGDIQCGGGVDGLASRDVFGLQNTDVKLVSSAVSYNPGTEIFQFDVTVQNLTPEAIGTPDGTLPDSAGIRIFFNGGPTVTSGTGAISVANADGVGTFTAANQPYYQYNQVLTQFATSAPKTWQLNVPVTATTFTFYVLVSTAVQPLVVINEVLSNPGGTISDANGEWFEIYNAGSRAVELQNLIYSDSSAIGRRPYFSLNTSLIVQPGGYAVLGNTTNTTNNGGVPVNYAYGALISLANSLDALKISRVYGIDTLTIDQIHYASASISAQNGISRELKNPMLPNLDMDGSNWADALVTAVYGPGGRGTPGARNSNFTP